MRSVLQIASEIVDREGGFVNDPDDPGGPTNRGVTIGTMRRLGLDLDGDGDVDIDDVKQVTRQQAIEIFVRHYFEQTGIASLPPALHASVFDMQVNAGGNAVVLLQRLLNEMGAEVAVDGILGPETAEAAGAAHRAAGSYLVDAYGIARRNYYYRIGDHRPASRKYARRRDGGKGGWIRRAENFISDRYHLTEAEHRARVAAWG